MIPTSHCFAIHKEVRKWNVQDQWEVEGVSDDVKKFDNEECDGFGFALVVKNMEGLDGNYLMSHDVT